MNKFAFIVHPLGLGDVEKFEKGAKGRPPHLVEKVLEWTPPFAISHITGIRSTTGIEVEGYFIACPLTSRQIMTLDPDFVMEKIVAAGRVAEGLGCGIVGLGAFTSVVGDAGETVARELDIGVTTGNSYTIYTAVKGMERAAKMMGINLARAHTAVVGATGSIGRVCAHMLAGDVGRLTLVARNAERLEEVREEILDGGPCDVSATTDVSAAVREAEAIITVTSSLDTVIDPCDIRSGAVVCDVARPRDVSEQVAAVRDDVLVVDGGVVSVPGWPEFNYDFGFPSGMAYACMSETMILGLEGHTKDYSIGRDLELARVLEIGGLAAKHGFRLAGLRSFERALSQQRVADIRQRAQLSAHTFVSGARAEALGGISMPGRMAESLSS